MTEQSNKQKPHNCVESVDLPFGNFVGHVIPPVFKEGPFLLIVVGGVHDRGHWHRDLSHLSRIGQRRAEQPAPAGGEVTGAVQS